MYGPGGNESRFHSFIEGCPNIHRFVDLTLITIIIDHGDCESRKETAITMKPCDM